jgi:hypothetical protein
LSAKFTIPELRQALGWSSDHTLSVIDRLGYGRQELLRVLGDADVTTAQLNLAATALDIPQEVSDTARSEAIDAIRATRSDALESVVTSMLMGHSITFLQFDRESNLPLRLHQMPYGYAVPQSDGTLQRGDKTLNQRDQFRLTTFRATVSNPRGDPLAACLYLPWLGRQKCWQAWIAYLERMSASMLIGHTSINEVEKLAASLAELRANGSAAFSNGSSVTALQVSGAHAAYKEFDDTFQARVARLVLGQNLTTQVSGGSFAAAKTHEHVGEQRAVYVAQKADAIANWIADATWRLNRWPEPPPVFLSEPKSLGTERAARDKQLFEIGVRFTPDYIARTYGLGADEFTITMLDDGQVSGVR